MFSAYFISDWFNIFMLWNQQSMMKIFLSFLLFARYWNANNNYTINLELSFTRANVIIIWYIYHFKKLPRNVDSAIFLSFFSMHVHFLFEFVPFVTSTTQRITSQNIECDCSRFFESHVKIDISRRWKGTSFWGESKSREYRSFESFDERCDALYLMRNHFATRQIYITNIFRLFFFFFFFFFI